MSPYLAAALRLGGPGCERAFFAREERAVLRGAPRDDICRVRTSVGAGDEPEPRPNILRFPGKLRAA